MRSLGFKTSIYQEKFKNSVTSETFMYLELLKKTISELEKQWTEKNAIITFSKTQIVTKSEDTLVNYNLHDHDHYNG